MITTIFSHFYSITYRFNKNKLDESEWLAWDSTITVMGFFQTLNFMTIVHLLFYFGDIQLNKMLYMSFYLLPIILNYIFLNNR